MLTSHQLKNKNQRQTRRKNRVRGKISGTALRPRLAVYRSVRHISAQLIDDEKGHTLAHAADVRKKTSKKSKEKKTDRARVVGTAIAERAKALGIKRVVFDRGGRKFHGRVKAVADAAREGGLIF